MSVFLSLTKRMEKVLIIAVLVMVLLLLTSQVLLTYSDAFLLWVNKSIQYEGVDFKAIHR